MPIQNAELYADLDYFHKYYAATPKNALLTFTLA